MEEDNQIKPELPTSWGFLSRKAPITIIGVLLFGVVGSALYDFLVKPGINIFAETLFNVLTLGSQQVKDYSFNTSALDPTSIPALILLLSVATMAMWIPLERIVLRKIESRMRLRNTNKTKTFILKWAVLPTLLVVHIGMIFVPLNIFNQAVLVWRTFNANIAIISPFVDDQKIKILKAKFASMHTSSDYQKIRAELEAIADAKHVQLREEEPW